MKTRFATNLQRVDKLVKELFPTLSHRQIEEALEHGLICGPTARKLKKGERGITREQLDNTKLTQHLAKLKNGNPDLNVRVVSETDSYWVVDKPAGVKSHPISLFDIDTLTHWAFFILPKTSGNFSGIQPVLTPHRLDTGTSGLMIVAKDPSAFGTLRAEFDKKRVTKKYQAICWGKPLNKTFEIALSLAHSATNRARMITPRDGTSYAGPLLEAQSIVTVLEQDTDTFRAQVVCTSGVTHQVRVHLAAMGYPIVGDKLYDPHYHTRKENPAYHQLRATELTLLDTTYRVM